MQKTQAQTSNAVEPKIKKRPILFVDRDGTLIKEPEDYIIDSYHKLRFLPGVIIALSQIQAAGWDIVIVTNQDGLGERYSWDDFNGPHELMLEIFASQGVTFKEVFIDTTYRHQGAHTRKPEIGLVAHLKDDPTIDWERSAMVGDRITDAQFAENLGIGAFLLASSDPNLHCGTWVWPQIAQHLLAGHPVPKAQEEIAAAKDLGAQV
ncbi:histidinol-phosphatase [Boudabousia liubingyangii]|uniref:D,D-heptose 1,7-bisphosphate phosphatase n=1 Tax=Boudabousia liubingyangii TaxID=1921764 RepID=A0A1Q5PN96_9ACTO|nr:histidinol-phosphatase [Boudabousia liubingyangii]OKL48920.1 histidinol-phosphatase [Boudabousia liubingyangii]